MTREEARKAAEVMLAYADGKKIEYLCKDGWRVTTDAFFNWSNDANYYRIKPQPKYRPFNDAEECWQEMQKHQPFGWIKDKEDGHYTLITCVDDGVCINAHNDWPMNGIMDFFTFADGQPFGIKEEKK